MYGLDALGVGDVVGRHGGADGVVLLGFFSLGLVLFLAGDVMLEIWAVCMPVVVLIVLLRLLLGRHLVPRLLACVVDRDRLVQGGVRLRIAWLVNTPSVCGVDHLLRCGFYRNKLLVSLDSRHLIGSSSILEECFTLIILNNSLLRIMLKIKMTAQQPCSLSTTHRRCYIFVMICQFLAGLLYLLLLQYLLIWNSGIIVQLVLLSTFKVEITFNSYLVLEGLVLAGNVFG